MAFFDFLGQSPLGTAQGPNVSGQAGVPQGLTYGQMLGALAQYGGKGGPALAPLLAGTGNPGTSPGSNNLLNLSMDSPKPQSGSSNGIWSALLSAALGGVA